MILSIVDAIMIVVFFVTIIASIINIVSFIWFLIDCHMESRKDVR